MSARSDRSMNADLWRGAVDGKLRFLRPNAGGPADESHAMARAAGLHVEHFGFMGISEHDIGTIRANVPTSAPPFIGGM